MQQSSDTMQRNKFKSRYYNHMQSFKNIKKKMPQNFPKHSGMPKNQVSIPQLTGK